MKVEPRMTTAAIIAIGAAIASFFCDPFLALILSIVAVAAGGIGFLLSFSAARRGGILSIAAIVIGVIALVRALLVAVF